MLFEIIYRWFTFLFGGDMADFLAGYACPSKTVPGGGYIFVNQFVTYGIIALATAAFFMLLYYYVINHPRFNSWWSWLLMALIVGIINLFIGTKVSLNDLDAGNVQECLINGGNGGVNTFTCWMFGLANFLVSAIFFVILSIGLKWWSRNCKRSPF